MRLAILMVGLAACDPAWGVRTTLRDPASRPVEDATVAVACGGRPELALTAVRSARDGTAHVGSLGSRFPVGCDVYIAKPGFRTHWIRYSDLCPMGPDDCTRRQFGFDLVLERERP